ncbi:HGxxPAAW family protein [Cellulomonas timonensis]|uniref:HGxxPAAW family protein n=1 Tax=Cellulomonas timonensis TaxID=1689271 RepID=UPI00082E6893|nr:HGxxPAAW family protein [Cellulomonas timonensis]
MAEQTVERRPGSGAPTGSTSEETVTLPLTTPPTNHGHTNASWTLVVFVLVGFTAAGLALVFAQPWLFWTGMAVVVLGVIVGKVMQILGHGQGGAATLAKQAEHGAH